MLFRYVPPAAFVLSRGFHSRAISLQEGVIRFTQESVGVNTASPTAGFDSIRQATVVASNAPSCRFCDTPLQHTFADLGMSPLSNAYLTQAQLNRAESFYPLRPYVCDACLLVQVEPFESPDRIFHNYAYFSSYAESWLTHARDFVDMAIARFGLEPDSLVVEIASNDGYLLQYFVAASIPVLGIEPAARVAVPPRREQVPTVVSSSVEKPRAAGARGPLAPT